MTPQLVNRSEARGRAQAHLIAAPTALDSITKHDALVAVLMTADCAPHTSPSQSSLLRRLPSQSERFRVARRPTYVGLSTSPCSSPLVGGTLRSASGSIRGVISGGGYPLLAVPTKELLAIGIGALNRAEHIRVRRKGEPQPTPPQDLYVRTTLGTNRVHRQQRAYSRCCKPSIHSEVKSHPRFVARGEGARLMLVRDLSWALDAFWPLGGRTVQEEDVTSPRRAAVTGGEHQSSRRITS